MPEPFVLRQRANGIAAPFPLTMQPLRVPGRLPSFDDGRASELAGGDDATLVRAVLFGQGQFVPP